MPDKRLLHTAHIPVRWGDMDNYGHVNNTVYLEYVQEARVDWFASVGIDIDHAPQGPVVLQTLHTYLKPVVHPATLIVELYAGAVGRSSLVVEHRLSTLEVGRPATAKAIASWCGSTTPAMSRSRYRTTCAR
jgi:acyl-CoA thioester hydrolase